MGWLKRTLLFLLISGQAFGLVHETVKMKPAFDAVKDGTLLIFDLDNTLVQPNQMLGSDQWYEHEVKALVEAKARAGQDPRTATAEAVDEVLARWVDIQRVTEVKAVEPGVAEQIKHVQRRGIKVMGLTARPPVLAETTARQLGAIGIEFSSSPISSMRISFARGECELIGGIFYIGPRRNKGTELVRLLEKLKVRPAQIVFADDKKHHVDNVEKALEAKGIPYQGFRYGMTDPYVKSFNPRLAAEQLKYFGAILGDREAAVLSDLEASPLAE